MKRKSFLSLLLVTCMMLSLAACGSSAGAAKTDAASDGAASDDKIVIGVISPNTGALAAYGNGIVTAVVDLLD